MMRQFNGLGLMSGTSLDGLDVAFCSFYFNEKISYEIHCAGTYVYSAGWRNRLNSASGLSGIELAVLHHEFGVFCAEKVNQFCKENKIAPEFIASHGHTVFHQPEKGISTQIGSGSAIAALTGLTTICDFRSLDTALGGQGAPLVPIGDEYLFSEYDACLNLGGIANISFKKNAQRIAFDICAVNILLNYLSNKLGKLFDANGDIAKSGTIDDELFSSLNADVFYDVPDKKSIGREWIEDHVLHLLDQSSAAVEDKLRTATEHIAFQISRVIKENNLKRILASGGGAYNKFLMTRTAELSGAEFILPSAQLVEFKEALIFALLGALRLEQKTNTLKSVTGAKYDSCGGAVYAGRILT